VQINLWHALRSGALHELYVDASQRELKLRLVRSPADVIDACISFASLYHTFVLLTA
jgi:hypothetical protein